MNGPAWWAYSPPHDASHLLAPGEGDEAGVLTARCGHVLPRAATVRDRPLGAACARCRPPIVRLAQ